MFEEYSIKRAKKCPMHSDKGEWAACDTWVHFDFNFQIKLLEKIKEKH